MKLPAMFRQFMDDNKNQNLKNNEQKLHYFENKQNYDEGLSSKIAEKRLKREGENCLLSQKNVSIMKIFAGQFKDFLVLVLLISTFISFFMGEIIEAIVIASILFLNAFMGFLQEFKTEKILEALDNMVSPNATVLRDGKFVKLPANLIVRQDIVLLEAGNLVPADCVVLKCNRFEVDESILTGESIGVKKCENSVDDGANLIYMGTTVVKGTATVRVIKTGMSTKIGKISAMINEVKKESTPIQKRLAQMGKVIVFGCLFVALIVVIFGILRGEQPFNMIVVGLSLAVASVPEGLPAIITIALSFAVKHMVKKKALVRKLHAVETLGCANLICTDKTGTITQNKMVVKKIIIPEQEVDVEGEGFSAKGKFLIGDEEIDLAKFEVLKKMLLDFALCSSANLCFADNNHSRINSVVGEPTEIALLIAAAKANVVKSKLLESQFDLYDDIPFDSNKKYMAVFVKARFDSNRKFIFVKGAYDVILNKCSKCFDQNGGLVAFSRFKLFFDRKNEELAKSGMRVLAFAYGEVLNDGVDVEYNLTFLGLAAMFDPPREEVKRAVFLCKRAGIKTVMITGDQKSTAIAIAQQVGIYCNSDDCCVEGKELDCLTDAELRAIVKNATIFSRVSPAHKLKIVQAFKKNGNIVAMTGDGVNDAPAIKEADIGVAMGKNGSDVSKQAADLVLLDDNFATLVSAVEQGRIIYGNMRKFIRYLLSCNFGEVLTSLFAMIFGMPVPLLPMQILLINFVTDGLPAIALGLEPAEFGVMDAAPRSVRETIFSDGLISKIVVRGVLIALSTLTVFTIIFKSTLSIGLARTATFLVLISLQLIHVFECKSEKKSIFRINYFNNKKLLFAVAFSFSLAIISIWFKPISCLLKNYALSPYQVGIVVFFTLLVPVVRGVFIEIKNLISKKKNRTMYLEV